MINKNSIYDMYQSKDLDDNISDLMIDKISIYMNKNIAILTDGLLKNVPVIGETTRNHFSATYQISLQDWKEIQKSKEFPKMKKLASILNLGLLYSYVKTRNPIFINFLGLIVYSSQMFKYFKRGFDRNIMRYTIDNFDARLDFKKFDGNLLMVLNKKTETFIELFEKRLPKKMSDPISDKMFVDMLQSIISRSNLMIRNICSKYMENFNDPDVKIMIAFSKTADGKNTLSSSGVFEAIRERSIASLQYSSDTILNMIGLGKQNMSNLKYRVVFIEHLEDQYSLTSKVASDMLDTWMKRNVNKITLPNFRTGFLKDMTIAHGIQPIHNQCERIVMNMLEDKSEEEKKKYNKLHMRRYLFQYILCTIYYASKDVANSVVGMGNESILFQVEEQKYTKEMIDYEI